MKIKIASAQYDISFLNSWQEYEDKIERWVAEAAAQDCSLLLMPEYASLELASLFPKQVYKSLNKQLKSMQSLVEVYLNLFQKLAIKYRCYIQPGTIPVKTETGSYRNRAYFFMPSGHYDFQEKLQMTRFENEHWQIEHGTELRVFDTEIGKIGINICYDIEFPLFARKQVEAGANIILVPSCTDTVAGYNRVRIGCRARALENQCYVIQSSTVGDALWSKAVDTNCGAAAIYTPVDYGFPDNGILVMGELNKPQWVYSEIPLEKLKNVREQGQVFNFKDWERQYLSVHQKII